MNQGKDTFLNAWLMTGCIMIIIMIVVGGITRLTGSGLSMVDWKLIHGSLPPLNEHEWTEAFNKYKKFPQFQLVNQNMDIAGFKKIFFWEYTHRLWGRLIGIVFFIPWVILLAKKRLTPQMTKHTFIILLLGGLQGFIGWVMVKSGLVDIPEVSHYRLALHLSMAIFLLCYICWLLFKINLKEPINLKSKRLKKLSIIFFALLCVQIIFGAFMSGLKAGFAAPTFPLIHGQILPESAYMLTPWLSNFFENRLMIQFIHRGLGFTLLFLGIIIAQDLIKNKLKRTHLISFGFIILLTLQIGLGIITLVSFKSGIPVMLASVHQFVAILLVLSSLYIVYITRFASYSSHQP
jgi:cytochrome c oxidase assembly protein subunit 15